MRAGFQVRALAKPREGSDRDAIIETALAYHTMGLDYHIVAENGIGKHAAGADDAAGAEFRLAEQMDARLDDSVFARSNFRIDQHRFGQLDGDPVAHQRIALPLPKNAINFGQVDARVAAQDFAGIGRDLRQHRFAF